ncbi:MAG: hypothetical protein ACK4UT_08110, partial [Moraxellaceae bacterium]
WLKHNLLRRHGERGVTLEVALVLFERQSGRVEVVHDREDLSPQAAASFLRAGDWESASANLATGSFFEIRREGLRGRLHAPQGQAAWTLVLGRRDEVLWHFPQPRLYQLPVPKKKLLTRDCFLRFEGELRCGTLVVAGEFTGMNGHNWGTEHAHEYAYANCNRFRETDDACFDGFAARLALMRGALKTPLLAMGALYLEGRWHHFSALTQLWRQKVTALDDYRWRGVFCNDTHRLEFSIDGRNPRLEPWVALHYEHPGGMRSVVRNTKFASARLRLFLHDSEQPLRELTSEHVELETLRPGSVPSGRGLVGIP